MKIVVRNIMLTCIGAVVLLIIMTVSGRMNRSMEVKSNLSGVVEETVKNVTCQEAYEVGNQEEYISDFVENMSYLLDSNSDMIIDIGKSDIQKGLLSVKVTEKFSHPNGRSGTVSEERTVIFNCLQ